MNTAIKRIQSVFKNNKMSALVKKMVKALFFTLIMPIGIIRVKWMQFQSMNIDQIVSFGMKGMFFLIQATQNKKEINALMALLIKKKLSRVMEIGTNRGGTLFMWCAIAEKNATIISIDLPFGAFGGGYPIMRIPLYKSFARNQQQLYLIRKNSHATDTLIEVKNKLDGKKIDFLFIDGDHSYDGVRQDFSLYKEMVSPDGIIAFHDITVSSDIVDGTFHTSHEVKKFWNEIKSEYQSQEIVEENGYGIGVLFMTKFLK